MGSDLGDVTAAATSFIISLDDARSAIGMSPTNSTKDSSLRGVLGAATPIMEDLVGPIISTARVETYDGGSTQIGLLGWPLISVTSVIESYGSNYQRTLTAQDVFAGSSLNAFGYTVDLGSGIMTRRSAGAAVPFILGKRNIQVSYTAGRATVSGNIMLATQFLVRYLWGQFQLRSPLVNALPEPMTFTPSGYAVPNMVVQLCGSDIRGPGVG